MRNGFRHKICATLEKPQVDWLWGFSDSSELWMCGKSSCEFLDALSPIRPILQHLGETMQHQPV